MNLMVRNRDMSLDPVDQLDRLQRELNHWFDAGFDNMGLFDRALTPALDLSENADGFILQVDLPGVDRRDISLTVENNVLTLEGEKKSAADHDKKRFFRRETWSGSFRRTISLPVAADGERVKAEFKNGVLTVSIGKKEDHKPRQITVSVQ